jgi:hypothetical protein
MVRMWSACTLYCALILSSGSSEIPACKLSHILHNNNLRFHTYLFYKKLEFKAQEPILCLTSCSCICSIWDFFKELPVFLQRTNSILQAEYGTVCDRLKQVWWRIVSHINFACWTFSYISWCDYVLAFSLPQVQDLQASFTHLAVLFK